MMSFLQHKKLRKRIVSKGDYLWDLRREDSAFFYSLLEGYCMEGEVLEVVGQTVTIRCNQPVIRAREGDALSLRNDPVAQFQILDSEWSPQGYIVTLHKAYGKIPFSIHTKIQLSPSSLGWSFQRRRRQNVSYRLQHHSWLHQKEDR